jgi:hypothetical protein
VPLLVLWLGYEQREAAGTSLAAIVIIGAVAAAARRVRQRQPRGRPARGSPGDRRRPRGHVPSAADLGARGGRAFVVLLVVSAAELIV